MYIYVGLLIVLPEQDSVRRKQNAEPTRHGCPLLRHADRRQRLQNQRPKLTCIENHSLFLDEAG